MTKGGKDAEFSDVPKIINLTRFTSGQSLSPIRQAEGYWSALRAGNDIPFRSAIDPRGLENLLQYSFILERVAAGVARFRLAGRHLSDVTGMEVRGMPVTALFTPVARPSIASALDEVFGSPAIAELSLSSAASLTRARFEAHMILLPLKDEHGDVTRALGVLVSEDKRHDRTTRFDVVGKTLRPLAGLQYATPVETPKPRTRETGFAEPAQEPVKGAPYLRLVRSSD